MGGNRKKQGGERNGHFGKLSGQGKQQFFVVCLRGTENSQTWENCSSQKKVPTHKCGTNFHPSHPQTQTITSGQSTKETKPKEYNLSTHRPFQINATHEEKDPPTTTTTKTHTTPLKPFIVILLCMTDFMSHKVYTRDFMSDKVYIRDFMSDKVYKISCQTRCI